MNYGNLALRLGISSLNTGVAAGDTNVSIEGLIEGLGNDTIIDNSVINVLLGGGRHRLYRWSERQ